MQDESKQDHEHLGWRALRPPPIRALVLGALGGAVAGAIMAWDAAVLIRLGRALQRRISQRRSAADE